MIDKKQIEKMAMPVDEIKRRYQVMRPAVNRIKVLAELNGCPDADIIQILGVQGKKKRKNRRKDGL